MNKTLTYINDEIKILNEYIEECKKMIDIATKIFEKSGDPMDAHEIEAYKEAIEFAENKIARLQECKDELVEKDYTLEEVKKMWEEKGFDVDVTNRFIYTDRLESNNDFIFDKLELRCHSHNGWMNIELFDLITKTLKALEKEKGK